jgi:hypothetical protein
MAWMGGYPDEDGYVWQSISIPAGQPAYLSYWYLVGSTESQCGYDFGASLARIGNQTSVLFEHNLCDANEVGSWRQQVVNMNSFVGSTFSLALGVQTDSANNSNFFVDDVYLQTGAGCVVTAEAGVAVEPAASTWPPVGTPELKGADSGTPTFERQR